MEIGKRYKFRERVENPNHKIGLLANKEFYLTGIGRIMYIIKL